jgi:hypothetical protein
MTARIDRTARQVIVANILERYFGPGVDADSPAADIVEALFPPPPPGKEGGVTMPRRIQRQRTKGWRMPEGAVYVGRPSRWGNIWKVGQRTFADRPLFVETFTPETVEAKWRAHVMSMDRPYVRAWLAPLCGKDLACWCPLDQPCHADVLLELANR